MRLLRRALVAVSLAGTVAGLLRLRGRGGVPPQEGGWREIVVPPTPGALVDDPRTAGR